jgi:hypothetical protein
MKNSQHFARSTLVAAVLAVAGTLPAHAGLLGGSGGLGGALGGGLGPRGLDIAGAGHANAQGELRARRAAEAAKDKAADGSSKASDGAQDAADKAKAGGGAALQRAQDGRNALGERVRDTASRGEGQVNAGGQASHQDGVTQLGGNAAGQLKRRTADSAPPAAQPTDASAPNTTTPAPAASPKRPVDAQADGSVKASRSERSVSAEGSGSASVQR